MQHLQSADGCSQRNAGFVLVVDGDLGNLGKVPACMSMGFSCPLLIRVFTSCACVFGTEYRTGVDSRIACCPRLSNPWHLQLQVTGNLTERSDLSSTIN